MACWAASTFSAKLGCGFSSTTGAVGFGLGAGGVLDFGAGLGVDFGVVDFCEDDFVEVVDFLEVVCVGFAVDDFFTLGAGGLAFGFGAGVGSTTARARTVGSGLLGCI
jgi:hypothetical protein